MSLLLLMGAPFLLVSSLPQDASAAEAPEDAEEAPEDAEEAPTENDTNLADDSDDDDDLMDLDIEQLRQVSISPALEAEVTSVSRTSQPVRRTPSAVYVLTNEMIRRSGARNLRDALRLVPGVNVAEAGTGISAISVRGANGRFANKILVQIDGRSIYDPTFAGTLWSMRQVMLEDVDRIEVIRGPGATVWGANAVNGVINIVTKSAEQTQGVYADVGAGSRERIFSHARVGGTTTSDIAYRVYAMQNETGPGLDPGPVQYGLHRNFKTGFRLDANPTCRDQVTFQGDLLSGDFGISRLGVPDTSHNFGNNLLARWTRTIDEDSNWSFQTYWNRSGQKGLSFGDRDSIFQTDAIDFDFHYRFALGDRHDIMCGTGYRSDQMMFEFGPTSPNSTLSPFRNETVGLFAQDTVTLAENRLFATLGCKVEYNDYTHVEYQPSARLVWTPDERTSVWGAISRAVRVPSLQDNGLLFHAGPFIWRGDPSIHSEVLWAYEAGMRRQMTDKFYWDFSAFYFDYDELINFVPLVFPFDLQLTNQADGHSHGCELWGTYEANDCWQLRGGYTFLREFRNLPPVAGAQWFPTGLPGNAPRHQFFLISSHDINRNVQLDLMFRYADRLTVTDLSGNSTPSYLNMNVRLAYRPRERLEFAVVGRNLFDSHHPEIENAIFSYSETVRDVYATASWRY